MISAWRQELYFALLRMRIYSLYAGTLVSLTTICLLWWYFLYVQTEHATRENQQAIGVLENNLVTLKNTEHDIVVLKNSIAQLKNSYQLYATKNADQKAAAQPLPIITQVAGQAGLAITYCKSCGKRAKPWGFAYEINAELAGSFDQIISFFSILKEKYSFIACKNFEIAHKEKENFSLRALFAAITIDLK